MPDREQSDLEVRVARLERQVEELLARREPELKLGPTGRPPPAPRVPPTEPAARDTPVGEGTGRTPSSPGPAESSRPPFLAAEGEKWLGRVGVGFVVLSFAFLVKLSFDRGWITPALRLGAGFAAGVALIALGLRLEDHRRRLAQAMLGGGVALLYLVGYAGSQLYGLLPLWAALSLMSTTTVLAIVMSERQDSSVLSVIGVSGGLATPFVLGLAATHPGGIAVYASLVLLGAAPVQFLKGWSELLLTMALGGTLVAGGIAVDSRSVAPLWPLMALVTLFWATMVPSPSLRPVFRDGGRAPQEPWPARLAGFWGTALTATVIILHFGLGRTGSGLLFLGLGLLTCGLASASRRVPRAAAPAAEVGAVAVAVGLAVVTWSSLGLFLVMAEACVLLLLASRDAPPSLATVGHWLAAGVAVAFLALAEEAGLHGFLGLREGAFPRLGVLALALVAALWTEEHAGFYRGAAYVGLLIWFLSELVDRPNGQALISIAWSLQGTAALLASLGPRSQRLQIAGLATPGLVAGKLMLVDLAQLDPVWRILLFLGFGATLLGLGYLVNRPGGREGRRPTLP